LTSAIIVFIAVAAFVCVWLLFVAPVFQEKEKLVRSENAALVKDIAEIEAMNGNLEELELKFSEAETSMADKYASRTATADDAEGLIERVCGGLGLTTSKIAVGQEQLLSPAGSYTPALYSVDITFLIEDDEEAGAAVIRGLENYKSADFEVTGFIYRATHPEDETVSEDEAVPEDAAPPERATPTEDNEADYHSEWIFSVTLYYYE